MPALFEHPFLGRGFRPFFLLGALYSVISLLSWAGFYAGYTTPCPVLSDLVSWHAHELIYGFTIAIVAGFLLTAVANWTGGAPARQIHLAGLCLLWLAGRVAMNFDLGFPLWLIYTIEAAFIPALAISLSIPLLKSWSKRNFVFIGLLSVLFACDVIFLFSENRTPLYVALFMIVIMISLVGGRVIPAFTVGALRQKGKKLYQTDQRKMDVAAVVSLAALALILVSFGSGNDVFGVIAIISAAIHALRMRHYHTRHTFHDPMLWMLQAGYLWLVVGLLLLGLSGFGFVPFSAALHALTAGAIGSMTLGMMCRVTLGHTGRNITASPMTVLSFALMIFAGVMRVFGSLIFPQYTLFWIIASACLWSASFGFYILTYLPMLWQPRSDGTPA
ncbi:MAG: NnrS family protein [Micavibrio sp.]|nr:NnrS family protein [Micavibrio sp.]